MKTPKNSKYLTVIIFSTVSLLVSACTPEFNAKKKALAAAALASRSTASVPILTNAADPHVAGGVSAGTSASFRVSGVAVGSYVKQPNAASANFKAKGGVNGQLNP